LGSFQIPVLRHGQRPLFGHLFLTIEGTSVPISPHPAHLIPQIKMAFVTSRTPTIKKSRNFVASFLGQYDRNVQGEAVQSLGILPRNSPNGAHENRITTEGYEEFFERFASS